MTTRKTTSLALLAAATWVAAGCSSSDRDRQPPTRATNAAPVITAINSVTINQDTVAGPISFGVTDNESASGMLTVTATASDATIFPADGIVLGGNGASRTITLTPLEQRTGATTISLLVADPQGATTTRMFTVTVNAQAASFRDTTISTFAKADTDAPATLNGFTFTQDADDPATFAGLIPPEQP
jgi:hypothetical protein